MTWEFIATLLGIYPPCALRIHFGFGPLGALLLNALGKYSALYEVHIPKVWWPSAVFFLFP